MENFTPKEQLEFELEFNDFIDMKSRLAYWHEEFDLLAQIHPELFPDATKPR
jgi:hypothetical protein